MSTDHYRGELYLRLYATTPFEEIEGWIDSLRLPDDAKAGLWLLAWAEQERSSQRRIAEEALAAVGA